MKSVLMSIQPQWCELIARGEKTIEVRKTKPKLETPFKVYIYETKSKLRHCNTCTDNDCEKWRGEGLSCYEGKGKVIGEFVCDYITIYGFHKNYYDETTNFKNGTTLHTQFADLFNTCLSMNDLLDYGKSKTLYGWHISNLKIYDKPKELSEFEKPCTHICDCCACVHWHLSSLEEIGYCDLESEPITRPPQSWCYVKEV